MAPIANEPPLQSGAPADNPLSAQPEFATVIAPIEIEVPHGKTIIPRGTKLRVVGRQGSQVTAVYLDQTVVVPLSSTDLR